MKKKLKLYTLLLISILISCVISNATDNDFMNNITLRDGLCGENIYKIFKDHRGLIWLGTSDGLNSFNGVTIHSYHTNQIKQFCSIRDIAETNDNKIYVATGNGVYMMEDDSLIKAFPEINCNVSALATNDNTLYIGTEKGLYVYNNDKLSIYLISNNTLSDENNINDIFIDKQKRIWIATNKELSLFDDKKHTFRRINIERQIHLLGNIHCLTANGNNVFLGSSNDGIIRYDIKGNKLYHYLSVDCNIISELSTDGKDELYVATDGNGAHIISISKNKITKSFTTSSKPFALKDNSTYCFLRDENGVNFFGFFRQGLMYTYYVNPLFKTYSYKDFTTENMNVRSFTINGKQKLIGTRNGFYFIDENRNIIKYFNPQQIGGSIIISNTFYNGKYYICTFDGGVKIFNPISMHVTPFKANTTLEKGSIFNVTCYKNRLWFTTSGGLFCYDPNTNKTESYTSQNSGLLNGYTNCIAFDRNGNGWIGTQNGVCLYNAINKSIQSNGFPEGFFNKTSEVYFTKGIDSDIIGFSHSGIFLSKDDMSEFKTANIDNNIFDESCAFICIDSSKRIWMGTDKGLFYFDNKMKSYVQFSYMDNLLNTSFNTRAVLMDKNNDIWMGTNNGLIYASTYNIIKRHFNKAFPIILGNIQINDEDTENKIEDDINLKHNISLKWNITSEKLSFKPIVLNYSNPANTYFEYKIDNGKWITAVSSNQIECKGMLPGSHNLYIRLAGSDNISTYTINVTPDAMAYLEFILLIIFIGGGTILAMRRKKIMHAMIQQLKNKDKADENKTPKEKYSKAKMDDTEYESITKRLDKYLKTQKPYLDPNLKMTDVANTIACSSNKLSQVFSLHLNQNYYDYINNYRLEEFKQKIKNKEHYKYTITALSEQCGFRKTAFFNTFKRVMGITPAEYMQQISKNN